MVVNFCDIWSPRMPEPKKEPNLLEEMVVQDIISEGLNPLNNYDVEEFWRMKGIEVDA